MKQYISKELVDTYRLRHHSFEGKSVAETARILGISPRAVNKRMQKLEAINPGLFPIFTREEGEIQNLLYYVGKSIKEVAVKMGVSEAYIYSVDKKVNPDKRKHRKDYDPRRLGSADKDKRGSKNKPYQYVAPDTVDDKGDSIESDDHKIRERW